MKAEAGVLVGLARGGPGAETEPGGDAAVYTLIVVVAPDGVDSIWFYTETMSEQTWPACL